MKKRRSNIIKKTIIFLSFGFFIGCYTNFYKNNKVARSVFLNCEVKDIYLFLGEDSLLCKLSNDSIPMVMSKIKKAKFKGTNKMWTSYRMKIITTEDTVFLRATQDGRWFAWKGDLFYKSSSSILPSFECIEVSD